MPSNTPCVLLTVMSGAYALSYMAWRIFTTFFFLFVMVVIYVLMLRFIFGVSEHSTVTMIGCIG